jgi:Putative Flp pilus-assembly TadE/G-like
MRRMKLNRFSSRLNDESGQSMILVLLALGIFLLGAIGFGVDIANLWFHRQAAQAAADAACTAGAMDMLVQEEGTSSYSWIGSTTDCSSSPGIAPCWYAAHNGYNGSGLVGGAGSNAVNLSYTEPSGSGLTDCGSTATAGCVVSYFQVGITDRVRVFFAGLLTGSRTMDVGAKAGCGVVIATAPVPIIIMNPTCPHALQVSGSAKIQIIGGPTRSIQVNSSNTTCSSATSNSGCPTAANGGCPASSSSAIDLCQGGPSFNGSSFGNSGFPTNTPDSGFATQNGGSWQASTPISDPFRLVNAPPPPGPPGIPPGTTGCTTPAQVVAGLCHAAHSINGCPDTAGCVEYSPGLYDAQVIIKNQTAIFDPGIYYMKPTVYTKKFNAGSPSSCTVGSVPGVIYYDLVFDTGSVVRPSTAAGDGSGGTMFYLSGPGGATGYGSVFISSNSGSAAVDPYTSSNLWACPGGTAPPSQLGLGSTLTGNILMGQCTKGGTYIGATGETTGDIHGLLFFGDRANNMVDRQPSMQGGGGLVLVGNLYFHNCNSAGTGTNCDPPATGYNAFLQLQGNPSSGTYVLGNITADELVLSGNGAISMALNPNAVYYILKATLLN